MKFSDVKELTEKELLKKSKAASSERRPLVLHFMGSSLPAIPSPFERTPRTDYAQDEDP